MEKTMSKISSPYAQSSTKHNQEMIEKVQGEAIDKTKEVKPPKRSWPRTFWKLFKRKRPFATISSSQTLSEKQTPSTTPGESIKFQRKEGAVEATPSSGDSGTKVQVTLKEVPLDEHKINGLRSGGGKFIPCLPSNARNSTSSNVQTLFFTDENYSKIGCPSISPRFKRDATQARYATKKRETKSKLPFYWTRRGGQGRKTNKGCIPELGRRLHELDNVKSTRFTYLEVDEDGNYGGMSPDGSTHSQDLTHLEYKECHQYEPKAKELKDEEMTFLSMDREGKYKPENVEPKSDVAVGPQEIWTDMEVNEDSKPKSIIVHKLYPRTSITSLDLDEDIFQNPKSTVSIKGSMNPKTNPLPTARPEVRHPTSKGTPYDDMNIHCNSHEVKDGSSDDGKVKVLLKVQEKNDLTMIGSKRCLPSVKQGYNKYLFPTKKGTLKAILTSNDSIIKGVDKSSHDTMLHDPLDLLQNEDRKSQVDEEECANTRNKSFELQPIKNMADNELNNPLDLLQDEARKTQSEKKIVSKVRNICLGLKPPKRRLQESSIDRELSTPIDPLQNEAYKTQQKEKHQKGKAHCRKVRNRCLGLQPLKYSQKKPILSSTLEGIAPEDYTIAAFSDDPWKGEEVAEFELRDFKKLKARKRSPTFYQKAKKGNLKKVWTPIHLSQNNGSNGGYKSDKQLHDTHQNESSSATKSEYSIHPKLNKSCLPFRGRPKRDYEEIISPHLESNYNHDKHKISNDPKIDEFEMDCTGTMIISPDSDDENDYRESLEFDDFNMSLGVSELSWDDSHTRKLPTTCFPFGQKVKDFTYPRTREKENLSHRIDVESNDPQSFSADAMKTNWGDDSNGNTWQQKGCLHFGHSEKKDDDIMAKQIYTKVDKGKSNEYLIEESSRESKWEESIFQNPQKKCLVSGQNGVVKTSINPTSSVHGIDNVKFIEAQIEEDSNETQWEESGGWNSKNQCLSFGHKGEPSITAIDIVNGTTNKALDRNVHRRGDDENQCPTLSKWGKHTGTEQEMSLFPSSCFSNKTINSTSSETTENDPNQVCMDLELKNSEMHNCPPFVTKSGKENFVYGQSMLNHGKNFEFDSDLAKSIETPLEEEVEGDEGFSRPSNKKQKSKTDSMLGVEYDGSTKTTCSILSIKKFPKQWTREAMDPPSKMGQDLNTPIENSKGKSGTTFNWFWTKKDPHSQVEESMDQSRNTSCGKSWIKQDPGKPTKKLVDQYGNSSCSKFGMKQHLEKPHEQLMDHEMDQSQKNIGGICWIREDPCEHIEQPLQQFEKNTCDKFWMERDAQKSHDMLVEVGDRLSSCGRFLRKDKAYQIEEEVDEPRRVEFLNKPSLLKKLEEKIVPKGCGKFALTKDALKQFEQEFERSSRASCKGPALCRNSTDQIKVVMDESERTTCDKLLKIQKNAKKKIDEAINKMTENETNIFQEVVDESGRTTCGKFLAKQDGRKEINESINKLGDVMTENETNQLEVVLEKSKRTTLCGQMIIKQDSKKKSDEGVDKNERKSWNWLSNIKKNPREPFECTPITSGKTNVIENKGNQSLDQGEDHGKDEYSRRANCRLLSTKQDSSKQTKVVEESGMKQDVTSQIAMEVNESGINPNYKKCVWLPLKQVQRNRLGEAMQNLGKISCGGFPMQQDPEKFSEEVAQENENTGFYNNAFSFKRDSLNEFHAMKNIKKRDEDSQANPIQCAPQANISTLFGGLCNQNCATTYFKESEAAPLTSNGGSSKPWFLKRYCACMVVSEHSSASSTCYEALDKEESINKNLDTKSRGLQKSEVGILDCMHCFHQTKIDESIETQDAMSSHPFDCVTQRDIHTFPVDAHLTNLGNITQFKAQQQEALTPKINHGCQNSTMPCSCLSCPIGQKDCVSSLMNSFGKYASKARKNEDLDFFAMGEMDPPSQQPVEIDGKEQHIKPFSQKSNRERWFPDLRKDPKLQILKPLSSKENLELASSKMELSKTEKKEDGHPRHLQKDPKVAILKHFDNSREGLKHEVQEMGSKIDDHIVFPRVHLGELEPTNHPCHTFCPHKMEDISQPEVHLTTRNVYGKTQKHNFRRLESPRLPTRGDFSTQQYLGDSQTQIEGNKVEPTNSKDFSQQYPENKWLRRERREPPADEASSSIDKHPKDDDDKSVTQDPPIKDFLRDDHPRFWQREPLPRNLLTSTELFLEEEVDTSPDSTISDVRENGENNHNNVIENAGLTKIIPPVHPNLAPNQELTKFEKGMITSNSKDERVVVDMHSKDYGYKGMKENPNVLTHEYAYDQMECSTCSTQDGQFDVCENPLDSNHQCLGRNWQKLQKQESIAQALEASETLLKTPQPLQLPQFTSSRQEANSSSGFSQYEGTSCLMSMFKPKEKIKPNQIQSKNIETQTNEEMTNPKLNCCQMGLVSRRKSLDDTILQEYQQSEKQRAMHIRRNKGYSTPMGELESPHTHSSRKALDASYVWHLDQKRVDLSPKPSKKKNEPFTEVEKGNEELAEFIDHTSPNWEKEIEVQKLSALKPAKKSSHISCIPLEPSVDHVQQERSLKGSTTSSVEVSTLKSKSRNFTTKNNYDKPSCRQLLKLEPREKKKRAPNRPPTCTPNIFSCARWTGEEDLESLKHTTQSLSGEAKGHGRKPNTYSNSRLKRREDPLPNKSSIDNSSSDDQTYDIASKEFRDNLFKNKLQDNFLVSKAIVTSKPFSPQVSSTKERAKNYQKTIEKEDLLREQTTNFKSLLQKFEKNDQICRSPVFKELVRVESQMREIARIITDIAGPEYLKEIEEDSQSSDDLEATKAQKGQVSVYSNPIWFAKWEEPVSIQMATRLAGDEVPIFFDDGFKIGYIPIEHRRSRGMRKTKKAEELHMEYNKFINHKTKPPSDDEKNIIYENNHTKRLPTKKRFSQKFTTKSLLHEKLHLHDHRGSGILVPIEAPNGGYSSSSSSWSGKEDLIQSHRRVFCQSQEVMAIRKQSPLNGGSDSDESHFLSPKFEMPSQFMGQVDEELARLKLARRQLDEGLYEPPPTKIGAPMSDKLEEHVNENKGPTRVFSCRDEDSDSDFSEIRTIRRLKEKQVENSIGFAKQGHPKKSTNSTLSSSDCGEENSRAHQQCFGWTSNRNAQNCVEFVEDEDNPRGGQCLFGGWMGGCISPGKSREGCPSKVQKDLENKEFESLKRRVQKDLGGKRKIASTKLAQHPSQFPYQHPQEEMTEISKEGGDFMSKLANNLDNDPSKGIHNMDEKLGPPVVESNQEIPSRKPSLVDESNVPISTLIKSMFGTQKTNNQCEGEQEFENKIQVAKVVIEKKVGALEAEIANFQENNRRLGVLMKENATHMSRLMRERAAWEIQKNSDMEAFQQYKEAEINRLQKERCKMEHQTRALRQTPSKEERKRIEELKAKLVEEHDLHLKKELQWRQTSHRLRAVNDDLKNQIQELRKEIGWHEGRLLDATMKGLDNESTNKHSKQEEWGGWNANRCASNGNNAHQSREEASKKEQNGNTCTSRMCEELISTKFKVEIAFLSPFSEFTFSELTGPTRSDGDSNLSQNTSETPDALYFSS